MHIYCIISWSWKYALCVQIYSFCYHSATFWFCHIICIFITLYRKQSWLWMQGDIHRAKQKERERLRDKPSFSQIVTGVDDMKIDDMLDNNYNDSKYKDYEEVRKEVNSLAPGKFEWNFRHVFFKQILVIGGWGISCEIDLIWMSLDFTDDQSTLVQVMAWQQAITWPSVDPDLCCHMVSLGHNELTYWGWNWMAIFLWTAFIKCICLMKVL